MKESGRERGKGGERKGQKGGGREEWRQKEGLAGG